MGWGWNEARVGKIYFTKNPNEKEKKYFFRCVYGGRGGGLEWVNFFFTKNPNKKKSFLFFCERERERGGVPSK